ncbi:MAG: hypothetical protein CM15mP120_12140 [Pseudomonadota bacterium]|nr:MAG: hypothetical protein CM15mP120_12140 [Pseudomonadota bacterium]
MGFEWSAPWRYKRLWEVLQNQDKHSVEDSTKLQRDYQSVFAGSYADSQISDSGTAEGGTMMADWDHNPGRDFGRRSVMNVWYHRHLEPALMTMLDEEANSREFTELRHAYRLGVIAKQGRQRTRLYNLAKAWWPPSNCWALIHKIGAG